MGDLCKKNTQNVKRPISQEDTVQKEHRHPNKLKQIRRTEIDSIKQDC